MKWCTVFLQFHLWLCHFLPFSPSPYVLSYRSFLTSKTQKPNQKKRKPNKALFSYLSSSLLASPFPFLLLTSLSPPTSPHLHLFFLPVSISLPYSSSHPTAHSLSFSFFLFLSTSPPQTPCHSKQEVWQYIRLGQTRIHIPVINISFPAALPCHILHHLQPPHPPSSSPLPRHRVACSSTQSLAQYILSHMLRIFTVLFIPIHCTALSCGCSLSFIPPVLLFLHCCLFLSKRLIRVKESADCDKERRVGWRQSEQHRGEERANRGTERESYFRENIMSEGPC